jgi:hypothetical protein
MELDSYTCDLCILQRPETGAHLFLRCNFAKACWNSIGVTLQTNQGQGGSLCNGDHHYYGLEYLAHQK